MILHVRTSFCEPVGWGVQVFTKMYTLLFKWRDTVSSCAF